MDQAFLLVVIDHFIEGWEAISYLITFYLVVRYLY